MLAPSITASTPCYRTHVNLIGHWVHRHGSRLVPAGRNRKTRPKCCSRIRGTIESGRYCLRVGITWRSYGTTLVRPRSANDVTLMGYRIHRHSDRSTLHAHRSGDSLCHGWPYRSGRNSAKRSTPVVQMFDFINTPVFSFGLEVQQSNCAVIVSAPFEVGFSVSHHSEARRLPCRSRGLRHAGCEKRAPVKVGFNGAPNHKKNTGLLLPRL